MNVIKRSRNRPESTKETVNVRRVRHRVAEEETVKVPRVLFFDEEARIIAGYIDRIHSPVTAIRAMCVECMGGMVRAIKVCPSTGCPLWAFRMGVNTMDKRHK